MFNIFKTGNSFNFVILVLMYLFITLLYFFSFHNFPFAPQKQYFFSFFPQTNVWLWTIVNILLALISFVVLNNVVRHHQLLKSNGFLPLFFGLLIVAGFPWLYQYNTQIFSAFLLVFAIQKMLKLSSPNATHADVFDLGFLIGLSAIFYFPTIIYLLWVYQVLLLLRNFSLREWLMPLVGMGVPFFYFWLFHFWFDVPINYDDTLPTFKFQFINLLGQITTGISIYLLGLFSVFFMALPKFFRVLQTGKIRIRKSLNLFTWLIFYTITSALIFDADLFFLLFIITLPGSVILAVYFEDAKKNKQVQFASGLFVISVLFNLFYGLFN